MFARVSISNDENSVDIVMVVYLRVEKPGPYTKDGLNLNTS